MLGMGVRAGVVVALFLDWIEEGLEYMCMQGSGGGMEQMVEKSGGEKIRSAGKDESERRSYYG